MCEMFCVVWCYLCVCCLCYFWCVVCDRKGDDVVCCNDLVDVVEEFVVIGLDVGGVFDGGDVVSEIVDFVV